MTDLCQNERRLFLVYCLCFISLGLSAAAIGPLLPSLADLVDVSMGQISFLFTASSLGYLIGSAGGGRIYDRYQGHQIMSLALIIMVVMAVITPIMPTLILLLLVMFFFGLGQGALDVGGNVNLLWTFQSRVGPYMNALHFAFGIGAFLSPIIIQQVRVLTSGAITWPFWFLAILFLPGLICLRSIKSPVNPEAEISKSESNNMDLRLVGLMMALFFLYVGIEAGFGGWIFTYTVETQVATEAGAAYMNALFWGALTAGRLLTIPIAKRLRPSRILLGNFLLALFFLGLILVWPVSRIGLWAGSIGYGLALSSVFPTLMALGESRMVITGGVTGLFFLGSSLGGILLPMLLGQIFEFIGSYQIIVALFGFSGLGLIVLVAMLLASKRVGEKQR